MSKFLLKGQDSEQTSLAEKVRILRPSIVTGAHGIHFSEYCLILNENVSSPILLKVTSVLIPDLFIYDPFLFLFVTRPLWV